MTNSTIDDKAVVREYFNATGFERWQRIYGDGEVNKVQANIRTGHQKTIDNVLEWFAEDEHLSQITVCDAGCGVGSLSIPLAKMGAKVFASDISEKMVEEAKVRSQAALGDELTPERMPEFETKDLEAITGTYHTVVCLDVLIHYPQEKADSMIEHLSSLASDRILISFAPKTCFYATLKKVGDFFPGPSKATRAYLHRESDVAKALERNGWKIERRSLNKAPFYFSRLLEATRVDAA
ncbi:magnesium protoporphyrin O-methyltransferase [Synechococcus sp. PCC 7335]|uniref:magnesium protoporphyrin IX methyltransferase n=1 Tax=Synechococcus sp. (strain ATCC 29403 / PCC 7335) TaxID=91464 RepID=UPI00017EDC73|nr:magnesium protoporphyrin IX methyltransferase [Synechococcus sp. PCC 7335]EDX85694.1 magnesium protoporphyrin O-methyltransferase [Synechococcus sp. PCC 7335]